MPIDHWIRQHITVQFEETIRVVLAQIVCNNRHQADLLYSLLEKGADFDSLAGNLEGSPSGARGEVLGTVDITTYPPHVRDVLRRLSGGETTLPMPSAPTLSTKD